MLLDSENQRAVLLEMIEVVPLSGTRKQVTEVLRNLQELRDAICSANIGASQTESFTTQYLREQRATEEIPPDRCAEPMPEEPQCKS